MKIAHGKSYEAWIHEDGKIVANAGFYCKSTIEESAEFEECNNSDLFIVIGLDTNKYRDIDNGYIDFQEEYAIKVAQMVYEMLLTK